MTCQVYIRLLNLEILMKLQTSSFNDDGWIVLQVTFYSEPDESEIHLSLHQTMPIDVSNDVGDSCTTYNNIIQLTYVKMG